MSSLAFFFSSTRLETRMGFCDIALCKIASAIPSLLSDIKDLAASGFKYGGDTQSDSKACTDIAKRKIYIGRRKTANEACLSLAYEIVNAKNASKFQKIHEKYLFDKEPSTEKAMMYAKEILKTEAEAVYNRTRTALSLGLERELKNKKYLEIVRSCDDTTQCIEEIFSEMLTSGTVHSGKKKALEHYMAQYFEYNNPSLKRADIGSASKDEFLCGTKKSEIKEAVL